ncbi:MAG TPA: tautomerase family protein [Stellaceae bacterium]|jgi:4-oxalocrotonate tautomerase|nr:tautomerase family protein [Stellaceae bacterium]
MADQFDSSAASLGDHEPLSRRTVLSAGLAVAAAGASSLGGVAPAAAEAEAAVGFGAPLAEISVPAGLLTPEQKSAMMKGVTDVLVTSMGIPAPQHTALWVLIMETAPNGWGVAGQPFIPHKQHPPAAEK